MFVGSSQDHMTIRNQPVTQIKYTIEIYAKGPKITKNGPKITKNGPKMALKYPKVS